MMPQLDGFGLLKRLRGYEGLRDVPVILLSARAGEESRIEGLDAGADDYLVKPFSARELLARVGAMLERDRLHRQSLAQLETENRQKNEFLAMLAHELRNPLAPIRNASELLARTVPAEPRTHAAIDIVKRQVTHLTRLVDDLLDVSRITQGRIELRRRPLALADVISQALETVEPLFREKRHRVSMTLSFDPLPVNGDPARLVQCVANILTNAAKYTDPNGEIHIESHAEGACAVLTVRDNGAGIPQDLLPRVFDLFVQSQRTLDRAQGGLGIGLSVVRRLIEMHGGTVSASSAGLGRGSTFEIRLPLIERTTENTDAAAVAPTSPRRILVVDDNQDVAESLAMLLTLDHHEVQSVYTPEHALQTVQSFEPDIVLLDIGLPGIDGYEVARRIRALPGTENVRLVALTGYGQAEDRQRAQAAGFDDHLVKPVDLSTLQQSIAQLSR
jgi:signal transduction histidine kinase